MQRPYRALILVSPSSAIGWPQPLSSTMLPASAPANTIAAEM